MRQLEQLKTLIEPLLERRDVKVYRMTWGKIHHQKSLEILLTSDSTTLDLDLIAEVSETISTTIDEHNLFDFEYILDIGSAGAEREFSLEEAQEHLSQYVFVKFKDPIMGADSVYGSLDSIDDNSITIAYRVKQATKKIQLEKKNVAQIRRAVRV